MTTIVYAALTLIVGLVVVCTYSYIKHVKQQFKDTERSNEIYLSVLQLISIKTPGVVNAAFKEIEEEKQ